MRSIMVFPLCSQCPPSTAMKRERGKVSTKFLPPLVIAHTKCGSFRCIGPISFQRVGILADTCTCKRGIQIKISMLQVCWPFALLVQ